MNNWQDHCRRQDYQIPAAYHYLNCAYMAPLSKTVEEAAIRGVQIRRWPSAIGAREFFTDSDRAREKFAALIGAKAENIALMPAVSYGIATFASNLNLKRGQKIVLVAEQFPSNVYRWRRFREQGVKVEHVGPSDSEHRGQSWNERLLKAIDQTAAVVSVPHVHWADGTIFDLAKICAKAKAVNAKVIVDGTQSIGALEFNLQQFPVDGVVCAAYKWLLGPYGLAFAYVGPEFIDGKPLEDGWIARKDSDQFQKLVDYQDEYAPGATRFDMGQRSNPILLPMACQALDEIHQVGVAAIRNYCRELFAPYWTQLTELGIRIESEEFRAAHLFGLRLPKNANMERVKESLNAAQVQVSYRGDAIRVSPHLYNNSTDVEALISALESVLHQCVTV